MKYIFTSSSQDIGSPGYRERSGQGVQIIRRLSLAEADPEVGPMYSVQFDDGVTAYVFADELTPTPTELAIEGSEQ
jgi:hypothetical protein